MKLLTAVLILVAVLLFVSNASALVPVCPGADCPGSVYTDTYLALETLDSENSVNEHMYSLLDHGFDPVSQDVYWGQFALLTSDDSLIDGQEVGRIRFQRNNGVWETETDYNACLLYTSPSPRDRTRSRMPSSA